LPHLGLPKWRSELRLKDESIIGPKRAVFKGIQEATSHFHKVHLRIDVGVLPDLVVYIAKISSAILSIKWRPKDVACWQESTLRKPPVHAQTSRAS
jgi:hypothetical protein